MTLPPMAKADLCFETEQALSASLSTADLLRSAADDSPTERQAEQMAMEASLDQQRLTETTAMAVKEQEAASMAAAVASSKRQAEAAEREEAVTMEPQVVTDSERHAAWEAVIEQAESAEIARSVAVAAVAIQLNEIALADGGVVDADDADALDGAVVAAGYIVLSLCSAAQLLYTIFSIIGLFSGIFLK